MIACLTGFDPLGQCGQLEFGLLFFGLMVLITVLWFLAGMLKALIARI
jgi:hypothetical protein